MAEQTESKITGPKTITGSKKIIESKTIVELEAMHTGSLMNRRQALLKCPETSVQSERDNTPIGEIRFKDTAAWRQAYQDLKNILDQREHLPSKQERKTMRQQRARRRR